MTRRRPPRPPSEEGLPSDPLDRQELDDLFTAAYHELKRLASLVSRKFANPTFTRTSLVHEAWLKLRHASHLRITSRLHFVRVAAKAMRQILVDAARRRSVQKRAAVLVSLDEVTEKDEASPIRYDLLQVDAALQALAESDPELADLVVERFFGGLTVSELAESRGVSKATIEKKLKFAKAWLASRLKPH